MFEKLLSLLPYNPGLAHQMAFYGRRMREEAAIRRTGLVFLALTFVIQFFAVLSPPQPTVAASNNDLINGGFSSAAGASYDCRQNIQDYKTILGYYGISCSMVSNAQTISLKSTDAKGDYYSMGRLPYGKYNPSSNKPTDEQPVTIPGAGTLYIRKLDSFDTGPYSTYQALKFTNSGGTTFYLLYSCGNLVAIGPPAPYTPPAPKPAPKPPAPKPCKYNAALPASSSKCFRPCSYNAAIAASSPECKPCEASLGSQDTLACIQVHKTAANITAGIANANGTTANPGDVITYTLYAKNTGKAAVTDYLFQEDLSDVLDYANVTDLHGGTINGSDVVTWPAVTIKAGQTATVQVTVQVKNPVPQTPVSSSDPNHFNLIMTNVYGNTVNIKVPGSPAKTIETTAASLPNTGPGTSLFIAAAVVAIAGYFYARARLLSKESALALKELSSV